ncbi:MAG: integrase family protein [Burkholderiales bacterium]|nr:integrase family protein [Burkholderiales bacterium]
MAKVSRLTIQTIESTRVKDGERWLSDDDGARGSGRLSLRIRPDDRRLFYFRYSIGGKRTSIPLGPYSRLMAEGHLTLEEARELARQYSAIHRNPQTRDVQVHLGRKPEPSVVEAEPKGQVLADTAARARKFTVQDVCDNYVDNLRKRGKLSAESVASYIRVHVASTQWAGIPANEFTSQQAAALLRRIIEAGHETTALHVRRALHAAYQIALKATSDPTTSEVVVDFGVVVNPISSTASLSQFMRARERPALSNMELGHVWLELSEGPDSDEVATRFVRLSILLGGQRCRQLLRCTLASVDLDRRDITLLDPKGRRLSARKHVLPLNPMAMSEVMALRQLSKDLGNPYLFAGKKTNHPLTEGPISRALVPCSAKLLTQKKLDRPFQYADIRSTVETRAAQLGIDEGTRAQIQSHGITGVQVKH